MTKDKSVEEIIRLSGNSFHCEVLQKFKSMGWHTLISPYYMDSASNKPREIDLVVEKAFKYGDRFSKRFGTVNIKLYIECKFIPNKVVFWFDEKNRQATREWLISNTCLRDNNSLTDNHRYLTTSTRVAKLFAGESGRDQENEVVYKALNQCLNAMVSNQRGSSIIPDTGKHQANVLETIEYPVILCNSFDKFYRVSVDDQSNPEAITENFQLEVNYAYLGSQQKPTNEYFLIDMVSFSMIENFTKWVESDVQGFMLTLE